MVSTNNITKKVTTNGPIKLRAIYISTFLNKYLQNLHKPNSFKGQYHFRIPKIHVSFERLNNLQIHKLVLLQTFLKQQVSTMNFDKIKLDIEKYGCSIIALEATDYLPSIAHTIGLWQKYQHPEIIIFGQPTPIMQYCLNETCNIIKTGESISLTKEYDNFFENGAVRFLLIDNSNFTDYMPYAFEYYKQQSCPVLQLIWTDKKQKFPWEEGFESEYLLQQPLLDRNMNFKFLEIKDTEVLVGENIANNTAYVTTVKHHQDGQWEFLSDEEIADQCLPIGEIVNRDPSLNALHDLDYGQIANRRNKEEDWTRALL